MMPLEFLPRCALLLTGLLSLCIRPDFASGADVADLFEHASQSVVFIVTVSGDGSYVGQGSGVVIKPETVVTNCHVLRGANEVGIVTAGVFYPAPRVIDSNIDRDLCLLFVPELVAPAIQLGASERLRVGERVLAIGAPHGLHLGLDLSLSEGLISSLRRMPGEPFPLIQTSAAISPGSSGGALLNGDGQLIGITTFKHATGENLNFAVPVDWILDFPDARRPRSD